VRPAPGLRAAEIPRSPRAADIPRSRFRARDTWPLAVLGLASRPARAVLSALGVALGIATMVAVLGISSSSQAQLLAEIDALGTNLLTVTPGQSFGDQPATLPATAPAMAARIGPVIGASAIGDVTANVYRTDRISAANTNAITVYSADTSLLRTLQGHLLGGRFLSAATSRYPAVVLGADAAGALGIDRADGSAEVWLGSHWFSVVGVMARLPLAPELNRAALIGFPAAERLLHASPAPVEVYVRVNPLSVAAVQSVLAATADPAAPQDATVTNPADALTARADAAAAFQTLFLGLGAVLVALAIGALAGLYPAIRAARLAPAEALRII
jgi:putative ABC transport system permease protein